MPDQINQTLGFNATQAIQTLRDLDGVMQSLDTSVRTLVRDLGGFNKVAGKTVSAFKHIRTDASGAATQVNRLAKAAERDIGTGGAAKLAGDLNKINTAASSAGKAVKQTAKDGKEAAKSWVISWQTMGRVVVTQGIVRALNVVRQSLKAAVRDAVAFQRAIAEIETIGRQMGGAENIAGVIRQISDEFNVGLGDTAEAVYQTISNQIASTAADVESFVGSAAKFAKITKTDLSTSVNLLSGTLNAFGQTVSDTEDVAAKFFKTIELGRIRAAELEQGYGTVAPTAEKLGIAFEEINAALTTLTIQGIQTDKAFTQIRGVMQSFLKPTNEMEAAMRQLGFATGEQLLEAYDLQEALRAVIGTTDGNAESVAKLIPRIRGLTGGLGLAGDEAEKFTKAIKEQETALEDAYDEAFQIVIETDAERITKELNKVKNFFTDEFGEAILKSAVDISELLGGAENLILVLESMATVIPGVVAGLTAFGVVMAGVAIKTWLFTEAATAATAASLRLNAALGVIGLAAAVITGVVFAFKKIEELRAQEVADALAANDEKLANTQERIDKELRAEKNRLKELSKLHNQEMAQFRKIYLDEVAIIEKENDAMVSNTKWALDTILSARKSAVEAIGKASIGLNKSIEDSRSSVRGLKSDLDALLFERKVSGASEQEQFKLLTVAAAKASKKAVDLLGKATTKEQRKIALEANKQALAYNKQAYALDIVSKSRSLRNKVDSQARVIVNDTVKAEEDYQKRLGEEGKQMAINAREASSMLASWEAQKKKILELASVYDKSGQPLSADKVKANRIQMQKEIKILLDSIAKDSEKLGLEGTELTKKYFENLALDIDSVEVQTLLAVPDNMGEIYAKIDTSLQKLAKANPIQLEIELFAKLEGLSLGSLGEREDAARGLAEAAVKAEEMRAALENSKALIKDAQEDAVTLGEKLPLQEPGRVVSQQGVAMTVPLTEAQALYNEIVLEMRAMADSGKVNLDLLNALVDQAQTMRETLGWLDSDPFSKNALSFQEMANALGLMANIQGMTDRDNLLSANTEEAKNFRELLPVIDEMTRKLSETPTEIQEGTLAQNQQTAAVVGTTTAVEQQISAYQRLTGAIRNATTAQSAMASSVKPAGKGVITNPYFAAGGVARGTDTQMAMLSAGERVTDAKNSRRFFSQLSAIGAGQTPVYRNAGGDTYNTNVGGISIHDKTGQPQQTAREVMKAIKREQRRGSSRI